MLDARITIINGVAKSFDRKTKTIKVVDHTGTEMMVDYDLMVISVGLVDNTIKELAREKGKDAEYSGLKYIYSIDDPYIYRLFEDRFPRPPSHPIELMTHKKRPQKVNIFGRSINCLCFASGLLKRGVHPDRINLILPPMSYKHRTTFEGNSDRIEHEDNKLNDMDAFDGDAETRGKVFEVLRSMNISIYEDYNLVDIMTEGEGEDRKMTGVKIRSEKNEGARGDKREEEVLGSLLVTCSVLDIDESLFDSIQENGLVYNGRLIVKNNFETVDDCIFGCGKIVEFSQQYKNYALGRSLRLDRYSGRELGQKLGQCVLEALGVLAPVLETDEKYEKLPQFEMQVGVCARLPGNLLYLRASSVQEGLPDAVVGQDHQVKAKPNRPTLLSDNLDGGRGHFLKFSFDNNGLVRSVVYLGSEPVQLGALVSLVGLSETYLNKLIERHEGGLVENVTEFLSENWAMALYHQWFSEFRFALKQKIVQNVGLARLMADVTEDAIKLDGYLSREVLQKRRDGVAGELVKIIRVGLCHAG